LGLRNVLSRRGPVVAGTPVSTVVVQPAAQEPLTPEQLAELQEAWAELSRAAEGSGVTGLHACSRNGKRWEEDPEAVRGLAATLRNSRAGNAGADGQAAR
jgi:hypothetical protein